ncbi:MAG TPA: NAD(+)/NADH kinase [Planctomycetota bacterium]|nr:NAD(+)/NADH kinase [Planctomycetota bacterium]
MPKIYIAANVERKPEIKKMLAGVLPWLRKRASIAPVDHDWSRDLSGVKADLMLVFGGDGSILSVARRLNGNPVPVFGVNMGTLGFLAETSPSELKKILPAVLRGNYVLTKRMMLKISVLDGFEQMRGETETRACCAGGAGEFLALNDAVVLRQPMASMMSVDVRVSGEPIARYKGDGLIVSTATGSTGYSLSAGGPILSERLKAMIVTPICPHTLANRPIVLDGGEHLEICPETRSASPVDLVMDGQISCRLASGTPVRIERAEQEFTLASAGKKGRYEIIRDKLHWAGWVKA